MLRIFILLLLCLNTATVLAESLEQRFARLNTWQADFVQTLTSKDTDNKTQTEGTLWLLKPNRFRLEYNKPYKQVYVADGKRLWFYDEDLEQISVKPQGDSLDQTPAMILSQPQRLAKIYTISSRHDGTRERYTLKPRGSESGFDRIEILFDGEHLSEMQMYDSFAQRTSLVFKNIKANLDIPKQRFQFVPPAGVDVIGEQ